MMKWIKAVLIAIGISSAPVALAADCVWTGISGTERSTVGVGAIGCTMSTSAQGMSLVGVGGFAVLVCADSGQTIATAFSLAAWVYDPYLLIWIPAVIWNVSSTSTGSRCAYMDGFTVPSPAGRVAYSPSAGTVSSGSINIRIIATGRGQYDGGELL